MNTIPPPIKKPDPFSYTGTQVIPEKWWTTFQDTTLNTLIDSALSKNLQLAATWQQVLAARAVQKDKQLPYGHNWKQTLELPSIGPKPILQAVRIFN